MNKSFLKWFLLAISLIVILMLGRYYYFLNTPASKNQDKITFVVPSGLPFNSIVNRLKENNLISDKNLFKLYVYFNKGINQLKAGEYLLSSSFTPIEIFEILISGKSILYHVTIPEGFNIYEIAGVLKEKNLGDSREFLELVQDPKFISESGFEGRSLEGYLFPSTYKFDRTVTTKTIINTMLFKFKKEYTEELQKRAEEIGFSRHQLITFASIVEKETGNPSERPTIASVFHNRLKKRMRLESDPTVIYGIENFSGNLRRADLQNWSPYNTYKIFGLPEGPIANPGLEAIKGSLWPAETNYFFFVSRNDGTHVFTTNYGEHKKYVQKYQVSDKYRKGRSWRDLNKKTDE